MSLIRIKNLHLSYGMPALFDGAELSIEGNERIALIGRNGTGKSTLLKIINTEIQPDDGECVRQQGISIARLTQEVPETLDGTVYDVVASGLGELGELITAYHHVILDLEAPGAMEEMTRLQTAIEHAEGWSFEQKVSHTIDRLGLDADVNLSSLSGGLKRRVLLAKALVSSPDILLLDEPTNHLDIESIDWLESFLLNAGITLVFVTHDRAFLRKLATRIVEIDRGLMTSWPGNFDDYLKAKQAAMAAEEKSRHEFDKKLAQEEIWIRQGIKARRTRNEGRVRALQKMRQEFASRKQLMAKARIDMQATELSGKIVIEAENISFQYDGAPLVNDFSTVILRGDKIGIIGPNGSGKTTLLNILLGKLAPQKGRVKIGTRLEIAYFDQLRETLDPEKTALENVAEGSDEITVNGRKKHIISYLQDFLFSPERARAPITRLSGGEKNRLLLARLFSRPFNLLVMDEPTNDLDVETLELLEDLLIRFEGTLLLVSHDRAFIDNVVTSTLVFEGNGKVGEYVGGYSDWQRQKSKINQTQKQHGKPQQSKQEKSAAVKKVSYKIQRELESIPQKIEQLELQQKKLHELMSDPEFYKQPASDIARVKNDLNEVVAELESLFIRWEELENAI